MPIEDGQHLLHYRIVEKIGEVGMGVAWKAIDTTLDREVAIKILRDAFAEDDSPRWPKNGRLVFFLEEDMVVMEVDVTVGPGPSVRLSDPREVFAGEAHRLEPNHGWDIVGPGDRFITVEVSDVDVAGRDLTLITDWTPR